MKILPRLFFKTNKPSGFRYNPRFYDEEKRKKEMRRRMLLKEDEEKKTSEGRERIRLRQESDRNWANEQRRKAQRTSRVRLLIITIFLSILTIILLNKLGISIFGA